MPDYSSIWANPLSEGSLLRASRENKSEFSTKSINKLEANPPSGPEYAALIAACRAAVDLYQVAKSGTDTNLQKAATQRLDALEPLIVSTGKVLESAIILNFESDPAVITEFFPRGRTELSTAKRGDMEGILNRFVDRATAHQAVLGAAMVTRLNNLRNQWNANLAAQSGAVGQVENARFTIEQAWEQVAWTFFDVVLQLAKDNPRNPAVADQYFDFSVFSGRSSQANDGQAFLKIQVLKRFDKTPIPNCRIIVADQNGQEIETGTTDIDGRFTSKALAPGFYQLTAGQPGFVTQTNTFQIFDEKTDEYTIELATA